jgi:hypothetical protein
VGGGGHGRHAGRGRRPGRRASAERRCPRGGGRGCVGPAPVGSGMTGRQAWASVEVMRLQGPHDLGRSRRHCTIRRYVTDEPSPQNHRTPEPCAWLPEHHAARRVL